MTVLVREDEATCPRIATVAFCESTTPMNVAAIVFPVEAQTAGCVARQSVHDSTLADDEGTAKVAPRVLLSETMESESLLTLAALDGSTTVLQDVEDGIKARRSPVPASPANTTVMTSPDNTVPKSAFLATIRGVPAAALAEMMAVDSGKERAAEKL